MTKAHNKITKTLKVFIYKLHKYKSNNLYKYYNII